MCVNENMRVLIAVLVVLVAIGTAGGLGAILDAVKDFQTDYVTDSFILSTNETSVNGSVQLTRQLWEGLTSEATITSNITADTPAMTAYTPGNRALAFNGLGVNTTRLITVEYRTFDLADYPGAATGVKFVPMALIMSLIFVPLGAVVMLIVNR